MDGGGFALLLSIVLALNAGCRAPGKYPGDSSQQSSSSLSRSPLTMMSLSQTGSASYEEQILKDFGSRHGVQVQYLPAGGDSVNSQLELYQQVLRNHGSQPDILMIDTVWPATLAEDLIDLRTYLPEAISAAAQIEIRNNTVNGRVIAIPLIMDSGVLLYRPSLLQRYGFRYPPKTWDELESMSRTIQQGERRAGNRDFWGYVWPGTRNEALTCVALEWFLSQGGTNFVEEDGIVRLNNPRNVAALKRAASWLGSISPPGVPLYHETDAQNLWVAGQAAFLRGWLNTFTGDERPVGKDELRFELTHVPAGDKGFFGVLGDMSLAVSKYAANRDLAIEVVREFTSESVERQRVLRSGIIPTRPALFNQPETMHHTLLRNVIAQEAVTSLAIRPSTLLGKRYEAVSKDVSATVNSVLLRHESAETALAGLQQRIQERVGVPLTQKAVLPQ